MFRQLRAAMPGEATPTRAGPAPRWGAAGHDPVRGHRFADALATGGRHHYQHRGRRGGRDGCGGRPGRGHRRGRDRRGRRGCCGGGWSSPASHGSRPDQAGAAGDLSSQPRVRRGWPQSRCQRRCPRAPLCQPGGQWGGQWGGRRPDCSTGCEERAARPRQPAAETPPPVMWSGPAGVAAPVGWTPPSVRAPPVGGGRVYRGRRLIGGKAAAWCCLSQVGSRCRMRRTGWVFGPAHPLTPKIRGFGDSSRPTFSTIFFASQPPRGRCRGGVAHCYFASTSSLLRRYFNARSQAWHGALSRWPTSCLDTTWKHRPAPIQDGMK